MYLNLQGSIQDATVGIIIHEARNELHILEHEKVVLFVEIGQVFLIIDWHQMLFAFRPRGNLLIYVKVKILVFHLFKLTCIHNLHFSVEPDFLLVNGLA